MHYPAAGESGVEILLKDGGWPGSLEDVAAALARVADQTDGSLREKSCDYIITCSRQSAALAAAIGIFHGLSGGDG